MTAFKGMSIALMKPVFKRDVGTFFVPHLLCPLPQGERNMEQQKAAEII
jgi:hypothetical protein